MIFNPVRDELITGGVAGAKVWSYHQAADDMWTQIKHMANYKLTLKYSQNVLDSTNAWVLEVEEADLAGLPDRAKAAAKAAAEERDKESFKSSISNFK